ncbi:MAG: theronine dehydrogenase [Actinobacteria bacterium]|nr:MAG: theronine dehydrogenase [Actinomycetota bacterium]
MRALTVEPRRAASARVEEVDAPVPGPGDVLVEGRLVGVCGTDREIADGAYGAPPDGRHRLVLGHEAVGRAVSAPDGTGISPGDLVVPIVRRPDPVPCASCAAGEWDMCRNGLYTEHGIKGVDGFAAELFTVAADHAVVAPEALGDLAVLVEPASIVAKAWAQVDHMAERASWRPQVALVTGAGPVGLLAALLARQRGLETHVLDVVTAGPKPGLVADLGATYHTGAVTDACPAPDVVVECTGVGAVVLDAIAHNPPGGIVCLTGLSSGARTVELDAAALNRRLVLENDVVFGTVNANHRHYLAAIQALGVADAGWLGRLITRRLPLAEWEAAFRSGTDDVKVVIDVAA